MYEFLLNSFFFFGVPQRYLYFIVQKSIEYESHMKLIVWTAWSGESELLSRVLVETQAKWKRVSWEEHSVFGAVPKIECYFGNVRYVCLPWFCQENNQVYTLCRALLRRFGVFDIFRLHLVIDVFGLALWPRRSQVEANLCSNEIVMCVEADKCQSLVFGRAKTDLRRRARNINQHTLSLSLCCRWS